MTTSRDLTIRCKGPDEARLEANAPPLTPGDVHVWFSKLDDLRHRLMEFDGYLDEEEKARAVRFRFEVDRERYIIGHGLLRTLLSHYTGVEPIAIKTIRGEFGKPYLPDRSIEFNLSDTKDAVLIAFSLAEIGADLETMKRNVDHDRVAEHYFTRPEVEWIAASDDRKRRFLELWTRKEAVLKASGVGIMDDLRVLEVHGECNRMRIQHEAFMADAAAEYEVCTWRLGEDHLVSVAGDKVGMNTSFIYA